MNWSLVASIGLLYAILIGINIPASVLGLDFNDTEARQRLSYEPPGYVIPIAWFVLFMLLGIARHEVIERDASGQGQWWIVGLAVLCASYAYYTIGLSKLTGVSALWYGLIGNVIVVAVALAVASRVGEVSVKAALLVLPVAAWTMYATAIVVGEMRVQRLL